ncbi:MAG: enoyl-CoA hydratase/isomerase family protein [Rhodospirillales bacterium]|nr:enoyl-CoA hydratase/isomerase family protein [Rhodospirillales bacterium]
MSGETTADVEIRIEGRVGRISLNRPRALNALTHDMEVAIDAALLRWADDPSVAFVMVDGRGERGLCAGGDIRALYDAAKSGGERLAFPFFGDEYRMNAHIANYPKPFVALMDGIVMGGGVGISAHGSHRIVTERTMLAMPEVGIGFVPDVGGTFLLGRMPGETGIHAALTAHRMTGADAVSCGIADHYVESRHLPALTAALAALVDGADVDDCIAAFATPAPDSPLLAERAWIDDCYKAPTAEAIVAALEAHAEPAAREAAATIRRMSPTSVKLSLRLVRAARGDAKVETAIDREFRVAVRCVAAHDFVEGVRAQLVDKDRNPRWQPATLDGVDDETLDAYFAPLGADELGLDALEHFPILSDRM